MLEICKQCVKISTKSLLSNKGRSFLTMLGIIIGVSAVIIIMAVGAGAQSLIINQVKSLGTDIIGILPGASEEEGPPATVMGIRFWLNESPCVAFQCGNFVTDFITAVGPLWIRPCIGPMP